MAMNIGTFDALGAYGRTAARTADIGNEAAIQPAEAGANVAGFDGMIGAMLSDTAGKLAQAEQASSLQLAGRGNMIDIVTAIGAAETALDTVVAVRDRMVSAYGEIMRMQV